MPSDTVPYLVRVDTGRSACQSAGPLFLDEFYDGTAWQIMPSIGSLGSKIRVYEMACVFMSLSESLLFLVNLCK